GPLCGLCLIPITLAAELGASLRISSGPAIERSGALAAVLSTLHEGEVLFLDEIHRMARPAEEMLYVAMEDFRVDVMVGKGPGATAIPLEVAPFTLVGATTRAGCCLHRCVIVSASPRRWTSTRRKSWNRSCVVRRSCSRYLCRRRPLGRSRAGRVVRPGSPIGSCAVYVTTPKCVGTGC